MLENPQLNNENVKINRALISVFDKTGLDNLLKNLFQEELKLFLLAGVLNF